MLLLFRLSKGNNFEEIIEGNDRVVPQLIRKFNIENGELYEFYTTFENGKSKYQDGQLDPYIIKVLNKTRTRNAKLTDIVSTIQSEQNAIIRVRPSANFVVQGCAGSGKTQILMHRLAYLQGNNKLKNKGAIVILTPNQNFNEYIQSVENSLGLDPARIQTFSLEDYYSYLLAIRLNNAGIKSPVTYKGDDEARFDSQFLRTVYSQDFYDETEEMVFSLWTALQSEYPYLFQIIPEAEYEFGISAIEMLESSFNEIQRSGDALRREKLLKKFSDQSQQLHKLSESTAKLESVLLNAILIARNSLLYGNHSPLTNLLRVEKQGLLKHLRGNSNRLLNYLNKADNLLSDTENSELERSIALLQADIEILKNKDIYKDASLLFQLSNQTQLLGLFSNASSENLTDSYDHISSDDSSESKKKTTGWKELWSIIQQSLKWRELLINRLEVLIQTDFILSKLSNEDRHQIVEQLNGLEVDILEIQKKENLASLSKIAILEDKLLFTPLSQLFPLSRTMDYLEQMRKLMERKSSLLQTVEEYKELGSLPNGQLINLSKLQNEIEALREAWSWQTLHQNLIQNRLPKEVGEELSPTTIHYRFELYLNLMVATFAYDRPNDEESMAAHGDSMLNIDEAQDLSLSEYRMLQKIHGADSIFNLYGDENQNIYPYRGLSSWKELNNVLALETITINQNYRNPSNITDYCNHSFGMNMTAVGDSFDPVNDHFTRLNDALKSFADLLITNSQVSCAIIYKSPSVKEQIDVFFQKNSSIKAGSLENFPIYHIRDAKGLEFNYVLAITDGMTRNEKYVAFTRALQHLIAFNQPITAANAQPALQQSTSGFVGNTPKFPVCSVSDFTHSKSMESIPTDLETAELKTGNLDSDLLIETANHLLEMTPQFLDNQISVQFDLVLENLKNNKSKPLEKADTELKTSLDLKKKLSPQVSKKKEGKSKEDVDSSMASLSIQGLIIDEKDSAHIPESASNTTSSDSISASEPIHLISDSGVSTTGHLPPHSSFITPENEPELMIADPSIQITNLNQEVNVNPSMKALEIQGDLTTGTTDSQEKADENNIVKMTDPETEQEAFEGSLEALQQKETVSPGPLKLHSNKRRLSLHRRPSSTTHCNYENNVSRRVRKNDESVYSPSLIQNGKRSRSLVHQDYSQRRLLRKPDLPTQTPDSSVLESQLKVIIEQAMKDKLNEIAEQLTKSLLENLSQTLQSSIRQVSQDMEAKLLETPVQTFYSSTEQISQKEEIQSPGILEQQTQDDSSSASGRSTLRNSSADQPNSRQDSDHRAVISDMPQSQSSLPVNSPVLPQTITGKQESLSSFPEVSQTISTSKDSFKKEVPIKEVIREVRLGHGLRLQNGDRVRHESLGKGTITKVKFNKILVQFDLPPYSTLPFSKNDQQIYLLVKTQK